MRRSLVILAFMLGLVLTTAAACPVVQSPTQLHTHDLTPEPIPISSEADQLVSLLNEQRVLAGCGRLVVDGSMTAFAQEHANFMANGGGLVHSRLAAPILAENIGQGFLTPEEVELTWMDSTSHTSNILNCSYTHTGAAFTGQFWVQVYGDDPSAA